MKITYKFVNGESVEIEVKEEIGNIIRDMDRTEETAARRNRYNERHIDTCFDHGDWNAYIEPAFDEEAEKQREFQEKASKALSSLSAKQIELLKTVFGENGISEKEYAASEGVSCAAITRRMNRIRKKIKKYL